MTNVLFSLTEIARLVAYFSFSVYFQYFSISKLSNAKVHGKKCCRYHKDSFRNCKKFYYILTAIILGRLQHSYK